MLFHFLCVLSQTYKDLEHTVVYTSDTARTRLHSKIKTVEKLIQVALFAGDCALVSHPQNGLQYIVDRFFEAAQLFSLTISIGKT